MLPRIIAEYDLYPQAMQFTFKCDLDSELPQRQHTFVSFACYLVQVNSSTKFDETFQ